MIIIKVDKKVLFKGEAGEWVQRTPDVFKDAIKPDNKPAAYFKSMAIILADALMSGSSIRITVNTKQNGWTMEVINS